MGSNGSKATSSCSSSATSSASGSFRKGGSKGFRGFHSYCLGTSSASHDSDNEDQVCDDQNKVNGSDVAYADGNLTDSDEVETKSFRMVKAGESEITCMHSSINLDEWNERRILNPNTSSGTGTSSVHASSTYSLNPTSRFLSRFSLIPGNTSFRLSRLTSLGSSRACPVSSASLSIFDNEDEHNLHPEPCSSLINRNETRQCSGFLPPSFVNPIPIECNEDTLNNLRSNSLGSGFPSNMQSNPTGGIGTREGLDLNLFSSTIQAETENVETRHINRQNGAREPVDQQYLTSPFSLCNKREN